jgi:hypothetical protein
MSALAELRKTLLSALCDRDSMWISRKELIALLDALDARDEALHKLADGVGADSCPCNDNVTIRECNLREECGCVFGLAFEVGA